MILHAVSMVAVFVDQVTQAQCVTKCMPSVPEPEWKWWFGALAPWVGPLLSGVVSIYVAWRVFRWQGGKDRKQWILDQKAAEWRSLILDSNKAFSQIHDILAGTQRQGLFGLGSSALQMETSKEFREALASSRELLQKQILIRQSLMDSKITNLWDIVSSILGSISVQGVLSTSADDIQLFTEARDRFFSALYRAAAFDLDLPKFGQSEANTKAKESSPK